MITFRGTSRLLPVIETEDEGVIHGEDEDRTYRVIGGRVRGHAVAVMCMVTPSCSRWRVDRQVADRVWRVRADRCRGWPKMGRVGPAHARRGQGENDGASSRPQVSTLITGQRWAGRSGVNRWIVARAAAASTFRVLPSMVACGVVGSRSWSSLTTVCTPKRVEVREQGHGTRCETQCGRQAGAALVRGVPLGVRALLLAPRCEPEKQQNHAEHERPDVQPLSGDEWRPERQRVRLRLGLKSPRICHGRTPLRSGFRGAGAVLQALSTSISYTPRSLPDQP